jgi:hypothetical protein
MLNCSREEPLVTFGAPLLALALSPAFYLDAYLGTAWTRPTTLTLSQPAFDTRLAFAGVRLETRALESPPYYGVRLGRRLASPLPFGLEVELIHLKVHADPAQRVRAAGVHLSRPLAQEIRLGEVVQRYSISHGVNLVLANVVAAWSHPARRWAFEARLGLGPTVPHTESTIDGRAQQQYEAGRLGWQMAAGVRRHLAGPLQAALEYKHTRTRQRGRVAGGEVEALLRSHHLAFGLRVDF